MSQHQATIRWNLREGDDFARGTYSREHEWSFDGGAIVPASPAPSVVKPPLSNPACVDPEEAFVASIASCHMLTFLYLAGRAGFVIESYLDTAVGSMAKNQQGRPWVEKVVLSPEVRYRGEGPGQEAEDGLHHQAHEQCFIANSVKTSVQVEPRRS
jgi:organic hydroperoxide reductase OsmC/OhrA